MNEPKPVWRPHPLSFVFALAFSLFVWGTLIGLVVLIAR